MIGIGGREMELVLMGDLYLSESYGKLMGKRLVFVQE